jgi:hypothetical protein
VLGAGAGIWGRAALWVSPLLFAMYARYWVDRIADGPVHSLASALLYAVPVAGGAVLLAMSRADWTGTTAIEPDPALEQVPAAPAS